jgi:hypothetical protein
MSRKGPEQREKIPQSQTSYESHRYTSVQVAKKIFKSINAPDKMQMAQIYQEAFAGPPWFEVYQCSNCGNFAKEATICGYCSKSSFSEAYPIQTLINEYFPEMLASYAPGVLIFAKNEMNEIQGFTTGGAIKLADLIAKKYKGSPVILQSIVTQTGVNPNETVFYENETCISPKKQKKGMGGDLNFQRIAEAANQRYEHICGRTVNLPWINLKKKQFNELGYDCVSFFPDGDDYNVDGQRRYFFMATKRK